MSLRRDPALTLATPEQVGTALAKAWVAITGAIPSHDSIALLIAHWAIETGWGKACHAWNLGNIKSREGDGRDYCYFACNEIFPAAVADAYVSKAAAREDGQGNNAVLTTRRTDGTAIVWFFPTHPACRFRAYASLDDGALDYLRLLYDRYAVAWPAIERGEPYFYAKALKSKGYYTADLNAYANTVVSCFDRARRYRYDIPTFTDAEKETVMAWLAETTREWIDEHT